MKTARTFGLFIGFVSFVLVLLPHPAHAACASTYYSNWYTSQYQLYSYGDCTGATSPVSTTLTVPTSANRGSTITVSWSSGGGATSCNDISVYGQSTYTSTTIPINGATSGSKTVSLSGSFPTDNGVTFTLTCGKPGSATWVSKQMTQLTSSGYYTGGGVCGVILGCTNFGGGFIIPGDITLTSNKLTLNQGQSATLTWSSFFGLAYSIVNYGPVSDTGATYPYKGGSVTVSPSQTTTYTGQAAWAQIGIVGPVGGVTDSNPVTITVNAAVGGSCSVSPTSTNIGQSVTWTASPSGGNGTYTYSWSGSDSLSGTSRTVNKSYSSAGTKTASVSISSSGSSKTVACSNSVSVSNPIQCQDGIDNDGDGKIDSADYGCWSGAGGTYNPNDTSESPNPQCSDGIDNNGNGKIDYPADPACTSYTDGNEQVQPSASLSLTGPALVQPNTSATLTWSAQNASSCTVAGTNGDSFTLSGPSGTKTTSALTAQTVFTLSCTDLNGYPVSTATTVKITPSFNEI